MSRPPGGAPPEGPEPPEPADDLPPGPAPAEPGPPPAPYGPQGPQPYGDYGRYGPPGYGPPPPAYGPPGPQPYGPQPYGPQPYGPQPYGPYGPPPRGRGRRGLVVALVAGLVVLVVCVAVTTVLVRRDDKQGRPVALAPGVTATTGGDGTVTMVKNGVSRPVVDVYEDFQCPICKEFHRVNDATLKTLAGEGKAKVVYHPIVIFSAEPLSGNSLRASAAAHCVDDGARWLAFQDQLFAHQPPEGSPGFGVTDLVAYGRTAGITSGAFATCVRAQRYAAQVRQASRQAIGGGVNGTPTVKVNGTALATNETLTAEGLRGAIVAAR